MRTFFLLFILSVFSISVQSKEVSTIHVNAEGSIKTQPDIATINLSIHSSETDAESAIKAIDKQAKKLIKKVKTYAIKEGSFDSSQTSIQAEYNYNIKPKKLVAYRANRFISFQLINLEQLENVINDISQIDLTNINNISFSVHDMQRYEDIALANAINIAKQKANLIAEELDIEIKGIHRVNHLARHASPTYARMLSSDMNQERKSSYEQKDIEVNSNIEIEFEIN
tara:strand:- start:662 stop:1342 length:681 start_codon:yes stop_codon:yes gene_type:complete